MAQVEFQVPGPGTYIIEAAPSLPPLSQPGTAADVVTGEEFYGEDGNPVTGTMPDNPAEAVIIQGGGSYTIPKGYHTGKGTVTSEGTELPTLANPANAGEIISGKQSIGQNGETLTGTMPNNGAVSKDLTAGEKYIIPAGYHNGQGKVTAPTVASETPGTAEAVDILSGKTAWVNGEQITGSIPTKTAEDVTIQGASVSVPSGYYGPNIAKAIPTVEQTVPTISVSPEGLITAQAQQTEGFVAGGTKSATNQLPVQGAQTITPSTTAQTIQPNVYLTGAQTIQGDENLVPGNIKENVSIFGVTGTYAGSGGDFAVPLTVTVDSGATVTAVNGDTTLTATSVNRQAKFVLNSGGNWNITASLDGRVGQTSISVESAYSASITLPSADPVFGVAWDKNDPSTTLTRLTPSTDPNTYVTGTIAGEPSPAVGTGDGSSPFDSYMPWSGMYVCNLSVNGVETAKKGEPGFSYSNSDVMVYIPVFYYHVEDIGNVRYFYITADERAGFELHPGSGKYIARYNTIDGYNSQSGATPLVNVTRETVRTNSRAKGTGWDGYDYMTWCAVWLLYLVEFADWNSQSVIGAGITSASGAQNTGGTDSMTYHTGRAAGTDSLSAVQYRGIENLWDNVYEWIDGINFDGRVAYICTNPANYADDTTSNYTATGVTLCSSGWIKDLGLSNNFSWSFLPDADGGSETTYIPDYIYSGSSWRVLYVGGSWNSRLYAGLFCFYAGLSSSTSNSTIGTRLIFRP